jgi:hypothetical protein
MPLRQPFNTRWYKLHFFHGLFAADQFSAARLGDRHFIAADVAPEFLANSRNIHDFASWKR